MSCDILSHPRIYTVEEHSIALSQIDPDAMEIIQILSRAGHTAYLVGGSVRDLLIQRVPKDFDISTSATPEEIKALFRKKCILIGRRFRLAHVRYGQKVFEVSTFRSGDNLDSSLILRDNQWGSAADDVTRRDFTINALYYDPTNQTIIDYVKGYEDLIAHQLRTIGDPVVRFSQDPVRMIRLLKFQARFCFIVHPNTQKALLHCRNDILKSASARIFEELCRMLESGSAESFFHLMVDAGLLKLLQPELDAFLSADEGPSLFLYLRQVDMWVQQRKYPLDRSILICCCLFPMVDALIKRRFLLKSIKPHISQITALIKEVVDRVIDRTFVTFPNKICCLASFILESQYRFCPFLVKPARYRRLVQHPDFALAFQFFYLRILLDEGLKDTYHMWQSWCKADRVMIRRSMR